MNSPLYEIAANVLEMPGILCEYGYWQMRVWGFTERDILHGTFAAASFGAFALCSAYYPERPPGAMAAFFLPIEQAVLWCARQRWVYVVKLGLLAIVIAAGIFLLATAPAIHSQEVPVNSIFQIAKDHEDRLRSLERISLQQAEQIKTLVETVNNALSWAKWVLMTIVGTIIGLNATELHKTIQAGKRERTREEARRARGGEEADG